MRKNSDQRKRAGPSLNVIHGIPLFLDGALPPDKVLDCNAIENIPFSLLHLVPHIPKQEILFRKTFMEDGSALWCAMKNWAIQSLPNIRDREF